MRSVLALLVISTIPATLYAQRPFRPDTARLQRLLVTEDARGTGFDGVTPLVEGFQSTDSMLRRVAIRGMGRLQRPGFAHQVAGALTDSVAAVRAEAGNALAQSVSRVARRATDSGQVEVRWVADRVSHALDTEPDKTVRDALAEALGRLPFGDTATAQAAERTILAYGGGGFGAVHGLYWIAANRGTTGGLTMAAVRVLQSASRPPSDAVVRRVAVLTLGTAGALDSAVSFAAINDPDEQVRRLGLAGMRTFAPITRGAVLRKALADPSPIVRVAAIPVARAGTPRPDCTPIVAATLDPNLYVRLTAIDALRSPCADSLAVAQSLAGMILGATAPTGVGSLQIQTHALVALAHVDPLQARQTAITYSQSPEWLRRMYAARAAAIVRDTALLLRLAGDADHNVREAAITGLDSVEQHAADSVYVSGLASEGYQVVLASANALIGSHQSAALPALLDAFDRLGAQPRENTKDPRAAVLKRISEMGSNTNTARLRPYLADFDTTVARMIAATLTKWTAGETAATEITARPAPLPIHAEPLARIFLARDVELKVTMSGGGTFTIRLFTNEAPATAARIIRLAREHYYDGHVFQRVEPNFVVQGGGPDASEYVGDGQFMRDEVAWHSHLRGTLGISSRGRDTGDAQWFFNLTDNTRLDHEYTVFGEVTSGLDVVEQILEGDVIARAEVVSTRP
jgi:cyclophilin family peptidyl-prolyl cis-trans isomerase/HEAT repeat protein